MAATSASTAADARAGDPAAAKKSIAYQMVDLGADHALVLSLKSGDLKVRSIFITGELGGKGILGPNFNPGVFNEFGDSRYLADIIPKAYEVQLKPLVVADPETENAGLRNRRLAGQERVAARRRPTQPGDSPRLLFVSGGQVVRVLTLENTPVKGKEFGLRHSRPYADCDKVKPKMKYIDAKADTNATSESPRPRGVDVLRGGFRRYRFLASTNSSSTPPRNGIDVTNQLRRSSFGRLQRIIEGCQFKISLV